MFAFPSAPSFLSLICLSLLYPLYKNITFLIVFWCCFLIIMRFIWFVYFPSVDLYVPFYTSFLFWSENLLSELYKSLTIVGVTRTLTFSFIWGREYFLSTYFLITSPTRAMQSHDFTATNSHSRLLCRNAICLSFCILHYPILMLFCRTRNYWLK